MIGNVELVEFSFPQEVPELARQAAELVLEIGNYKHTKGVDTILEGMTDRTTVIALNGHEQVIGTAGLHIVSPRLATLEEVVSHPRKRGAGIGRMVVEAVEGIALRKGVVELNLASSIEGIPFYNHLGYTQLGERIFRKFL